MPAVIRGEEINEITKMPTSIRSIDWTREPVLQSEHDARTRVYMATPILTGNNAFKGEIITYPPDTAAPEHHHEGAKHFQYMVVGQCTALLNGVATQLMAGDVLYNYENEIHAFINEGTEDLVFVEFFVQGHAKQSGYLGPICAPGCQPEPTTGAANPSAKLAITFMGKMAEFDARCVVGEAFLLKAAFATGLLDPAPRAPITNCLATKPIEIIRFNKNKM